jgi:hypothetical protein
MDRANISKTKESKKEEKIVLAWTNLVVCTSAYTFNGALVHPQKQRVLDVLNKGGVAEQPRLPSDFLQMVEVDVCANSNKKDRMVVGSCYIVKSNILFAVAREEWQNAGVTVKRPQDLSFRKKAQRLVNVYIPPFVLTGQLYTETQQKVSNILATSEDFLPMTDVEILPSMVTGDAAAKFIAVNKHHVSYIAEIL